MRSLARGGGGGGGVNGNGPAPPDGRPESVEGGQRAEGLESLRMKAALLRDLATELLSEVDSLELGGAVGVACDGRALLRDEVDRLEVKLITRALREAGWNQAVAARRLGLRPTTLFYKIRCHGIDLPGHAGGEPPAPAAGGGRPTRRPR